MLTSGQQSWRPRLQPGLAGDRHRSGLTVQFWGALQPIHRGVQLTAWTWVLAGPSSFHGGVYISIPDYFFPWLQGACPRVCQSTHRGIHFSWLGRGSSPFPQGNLKGKLGTCRLLSHLTMILMVSASCAAYSENLGTLESGQQIGTLEIIFSTQAENLLQKPLGREFQASGFQSESSWSQVSCLK